MKEAVVSLGEDRRAEWRGLPRAYTLPRAVHFAKSNLGAEYAADSRDAG
jgi:hypothetical protein